MDYSPTIHLFQEALQREESLEIERYQGKSEGLSRKQKVLQGTYLQNLEVTNLSLLIESKWAIDLRFSGSRGEFQNGQKVRCIFQENHLDGILQVTGRSSLRLIVSEFPEILDQCPVDLSLLHQDVTYRAMQEALTQLKSEKKDQGGKTRRVLLGLSPPTRTPSRLTSSILENWIKDNGPLPEAFLQLNDSQKRAAALVYETDDFHLIHGPPGTGKTTTLSAAVALRKARPGERILVCAPTNAAVDVIARSLKKMGIGFLRLGHPARVHGDLLENTLEGHLQNHRDAKLIERYRKEALELLKNAKKYKRNFGAKEKENRKNLFKEYRDLQNTIRLMERGIEESIVSHHNIFLATPVGSLQKNISRNSAFTTVFLDEAGQLIEPAAWIALNQGATLILAGDHKQLPPTVLSNDDLLKRTLFEKAIELHEQTNPEKISFLDTQYRMSPPIGDFSNIAFYDRKLKNARQIASRERLLLEPFGSPLVLIDTSGSDCSEKEENESYYNPCEIKIIQAILAMHLPFLQNRNWSASVISTYRSQADHLHDALTASMDVESETVDAFQGGERDWIAVSLVRSNGNEQTGFLSEIRRLNVALTRAKHFLLIVCDSSTVGSHPFYEALIEFVQNNGDYRSIYDPELPLQDLL